MKKILLLMLMALPFVFISCSDDDDPEPKVDNDIKITKSEYKMNYEDKVQIDAQSALDISYSSESDYVATVSQSGLITGGRVGETSISLNNGVDAKKVNIIIDPKYNLFPEPVKKIQFGATPKMVKDAFGSSPTLENDKTIYYKSYYSFYEYIFSMEDGKLNSIFVIFDMFKMPSDLVEFLAERYKIVRYKDDVASFLNEKEDLLIATFPSEDFMYFVVGYTKFDSKKESLKSLVDIEYDLLMLKKEYKSVKQL